MATVVIIDSNNQSEGIRSGVENVSADAKSVSERRRQEITEIVRKENELNRKRKERGAHSSAIITFAGYESSESDEDMNDEERRNLKAFRLNQKIRSRKNAIVVPRKKVKYALATLNSDFKSLRNKLTAAQKRLDVLKKHCTRSSQLEGNHDIEHTWDSPIYIAKAIRTCLLTRNWNNLTRLVLMLLRHKKSYVSYVKQLTLLNLQNNPTDSDGQLLNRFLQLLAMKTETDV